MGTVLFDTFCEEMCQKEPSPVTHLPAFRCDKCGKIVIDFKK